MNNQLQTRIYLLWSMDKGTARPRFLFLFHVIHTAIDRILLRDKHNTQWSEWTERMDKLTRLLERQQVVPSVVETKLGPFLVA